MSSQPVVRKGALSFKGQKPLKRVIATPGVPDADTSAPQPKKPAVVQVDEYQCDGRVVANGTTVQGMETRFKDQLSVGDVLIVMHPQSLLPEKRTVTNILSQRSLMVHAPFSSDFMTTTEFAVRKESQLIQQRISQSSTSLKKEEGHDDHDDSKVIAVDQAVQDELKRKLDNEEKILTYREKVGTWGYRTVSVKVDKNTSKEDLLDMQSKKVHDRYCK